MPAAATPARRAAAPAWQVAAATATGAYHLTIGTGREDAYAISPEPARSAPVPSVAVAVADGHGHQRHFRSARGAAMASSVATRVGDRLAARLPALEAADEVEALLRGEVGPEIVETWRREVEADLAASPPTADELLAAGLDGTASLDELIIGYGATLLVTVAAGPWLAFAQIGDGDLFAIHQDGSVAHPLPTDPLLDGLHTTSICQPDALSAMRYAVLDTRTSPIGAVMLATDGYGNAQARDDWEDAFGPDLARFAAEHGIGWIAQQLPNWAEQCASSSGSGDDVTVALLFAANAAWRPASRPVLDTSATTIVDLPPATARRAASPVPPHAAPGVPDDHPLAVPHAPAPAVPQRDAPATAQAIGHAPAIPPTVPPAPVAATMPSGTARVARTWSTVRVLAVLIGIVVVALAVVLYFAFFHGSAASPAGNDGPAVVSPAPTSGSTAPGATQPATPSTGGNGPGGTATGGGNGSGQNGTGTSPGSGDGPASPTPTGESV